MSSTFTGNARLDWRAIENLAAQSGMVSEHVSLGEEDALDAASNDERTISRRFELDNFARKTRTVLELLEDQVLRISERRGALTQPSYCVDLRCVEPRILTWRRRTTAGFITLGTLVMSVCFAALAYLGFLPGLTAPVAAALVGMTAAAARIYVKRYEERIGMRTRHGKAPIHVLSANIGCIRKGRKLARELRHAIKRAHHADRRSENDRLRAEIKAHYRLAEAGVISQRTCTAAIRKTLSRFS